MRLEIRSASDFLMNILRLGRNLEPRLLDIFRGSIEDLLRHHYQHHWFPERPTKGSAYRCIRINHKMDPLIAKAGKVCGLEEASLRELFPNELTLWVDPREVSYRIGENGSICVLYDGSGNSNSSSTSSSNGYSNNSLTASPHGALSYHHNSHTLSSNHHLHHHPYGSERFSRPGCKASSWDPFVADPRNLNFESLATYVSS
ncbi:protein BTG2-like [Ornithodoros turicata]|uniref:Putative anti-proliferation factor btg1/tob n=1 Tax=Ornithodoros turicata TaxID=34597 RepID=A0A2R5L5A3_9ACAR